MQFLLRSLFVGSSNDDGGLVYNNISVLKNSGLQFDVVEYHKIWEFIDSFAKEHHHAPSITTVKNHFDRNGELDITNQLEVIKTLKPIYKGDFKKRLESRADEQRIKKLELLLKDCNEINYHGMEIKEGNKKRLVKGPIDAISHFSKNSPNLIRSSSGIKKSGNTITVEDVDEFVEDYNLRKNDPLYNKGYTCGLMQMDESMGGAKNKQMWTHAAFTGHLKSTLAMNWVYYQAIYSKENSLYYSLEMPYEQCKRIIYVMHSMHEKFNSIRMELGIQENESSISGLEYKSVRDGKLDEKEEYFLKNYVLKDLKDQDNNYGKIMIRSYDKMNFTVSDIKSEGESMYRENPFGLMVIDHVLLVDSLNRHPNTTERCNEVVRDLKKICEIFNDGEGIAILALFQISREGVKRADKADGMYSLYDLSYSNEIERSSDIVTASYLNKEMRESARVLIQCLKSRDDAEFKPFYSRIEWPCRRMLTCLDDYDSETGKVSDGGYDNFEKIF